MRLTFLLFMIGGVLQANGMPLEGALHASEDESAENDASGGSGMPAPGANMDPMALLNAQAPFLVMPCDESKRDDCDTFTYGPTCVDDSGNELHDDEEVICVLCIDVNFSNRLAPTDAG